MSLFSQAQKTSGQLASLMFLKFLQVCLSSFVEHSKVCNIAKCNTFETQVCGNRSICKHHDSNWDKQKHV